MPNEDTHYTQRATANHKINSTKGTQAEHKQMCIKHYRDAKMTITDQNWNGNISKGP